MKYGQLKGFKNGQAHIIMHEPITNDYTIEMFHNDRCNNIETLKYNFDRFETELVKEN